MIFDRALCGIDDSEQSLAALKKLLRLVPPGAAVTAISALDVNAAVNAGFAATTITDELRRGLEENLERVAAAGVSVATRLVEGSPMSVLLETIRNEDVTLVAVGSHGLPRSAGIVIGSVATALVHDAPCSVLVARGDDDAGSFPSAIVVGVDGSPGAAKAAAVARELHERLGVPLEAVVARGGTQGDAETATAGLDVSVDERRPVAALSARAEPSGLIVVGSRGLRGLRALGSVSERLAHSAHASVLVVR
jgi:nucleotide-binding universal stress UspA family protein